MTTDLDPYDALGQELVRAAARSATAPTTTTIPTVDHDGPRRSRALRWLSRHTVIALVAGTAVTATATAAVVTGLRGTPSSPLAGATVSSAPPGEGLSDGTYRLSYSPLPSVGFVGWCSSVVVLHERRDENYGGGGCHAAPTTRRHLADSGYTGSDEEGIATFVVDGTVGGLRLSNGRIVVPRESSGLPPGRRVIIVRSGDPRHGLRFDNRSFARWRLLDRSGVSLGPPDDRQADEPGYSVGEQPSRSTRGETFPADAPCRIERAEGLVWPGTARVGRNLESLRDRPAPTANLNGRGFLSCAGIGTNVGVIDPVTATVLLDAAHPGKRPAPLPGMAGPDDGTPVDVAWTFSGGSLGGDTGPTATAQRRGNAWLVVSGDSPTHRRELLAKLTVQLNL